MPKTKISEFSSTPANNTDIDSINIAEGCAPSGINDAIRELMAQLKDFQTGAVGDSFNGPVGTTTPAAGAFTTLSATGNVTLGDASTDTLNVGNGGLIKDASGNLGLGVTPNVWRSASKAFQINSTASIRGETGLTALISNAYTNTSSQNIYITSDYATQYAQFSGSHVWYNAPSGTAGNAITFTQAMTLDASGNLGVGTTSPQAPLHIKGTNASEILRLESTDTTGDCYIRYTDPNGAKGYIGYVESATNNFAIHNTLNTPMLFYTNNTERARFDSSGNLLVGKTTTSSAETTVGFQVNSNGRIFAVADGFNSASFGRNSSDGDIVTFHRGSTTKIGSISGTTTATAYNTSSDYRLKNTIAPMTGALAKVALLKPCTYKWNADGSDGEGFIAHELAEVVPQCVSGEKDAVDEEGNPQYQGIDVSFLVATLTAAIQEQQALITQLQADVAALKA